MDDFTQFQSTAIDATIHISPTLVRASSSGVFRRLNRVNQQFGNYRLLLLLAQGGFSEVYLGEHIHLGTFAAIKVVHTQVAAEDLEQFREEARIVARLRHPHIVNILDFNVQDGTPFLVMDYAPNGSLRQRHPRGTLLSPLTVLPYLKQVASALQYAHNQRLVHRDVKPENMLLGWHKEILLSDFGIAVVLPTSRIDMKHEVIGTIAYMSPEQFTGRALPASDQYALAIVAYEWLCGAYPFWGSIVEMAAQHASASPPSLCARNAEVSPALEQVIFKALAKDPAQRYPSVRDFASAFAAACPYGGRIYEVTMDEDSIAQMPTLKPQELAAYTKPHKTNSVEPYLHEQKTEPQGNDVAQLSHTPRSRFSRFSRRHVLIGLAGLASLSIASSTLTWLANTYTYQPASKPQPTPMPTATPTPPGTLLYTYHGHAGIVTTLAWSSENSIYIASASKDHTARVWATTSGADTRNYTRHTDTVNAVVWSPDGQYVVSASNDKTAQVWAALREDDPIVIYKGHADVVRAVSWCTISDPKSQYIASGGDDKLVRIWRPDNGREIAAYNKHADDIHTVAWSPDGKYIASGSSDKSVHVWDPTKSGNTSQPIVHYQHHTDTVNAVAWSPDGQYIASASSDKSVHVWLAVIGGNPLITYGGHTAAVNAVAWSPDGKRIASASDDGTVHIWNASDGSEILTYQGHFPNAVLSLAWSPDGQYIASASADKTVQMWYT